MKTITHLNYIWLILWFFSFSFAASATLIESAQTGSWGNTATWVGGVIPGSANDVIIKAEHTVTTVNTTENFATLQIEATATLNLVHSTILAGTGGITNSGTMNINGSVVIESNLTNHGVVTWASGNLTSAAGSTLTNFGTLNINVINIPTVQLNFVNENLGTIIYGGITGTQTIPTSFTNKAGGMVTINTGKTLLFSGTLSNSGSFAVTGGLALSGATSIFNGGVFGGTGTLTISGTNAVSGTAGFVPAFTTVSHIGALTGTGLSMTIPSGTTYTMTTGTMAGFTGLTNAGALTITGNCTFENDITNNGVITWAQQNLTSTAGSTLTNFGTFNLNAINAPTVQLNFVNENIGNIIKGGPSGSQIIPTSFTNKAGGTVTIPTGKSLTFSGTFSNAGSFAVTGGLILSGATSIFNGGVFGGTGTLTISGTNAVSGSAGFVPAFTTVSHVGTLTGTGLSMTIPSGTTYTMTTVTIAGFTGLTNAGTLTIGGNCTFENDITNNGVITWAQQNLSSTAGSTLTNFGTFNLNAINVSTVQLNFVNENIGNIIKGGSSGTQLIPTSFTNKAGGTVTIPTGKGLTLGSPAVHGGYFDISGTLTFSNTITNSVLTGNLLTNNGTVSVGTGRSVEFAGSALQTIAGNGTITAITVNNTNGLDITGNQNITGALTLTTGKVLLAGNDLQIGSVSGGSAASFVVTSGVGRLVQNVTTAGQWFPVGPNTGSYNPAMLDQLSGTARYGISVKAGLDNPIADDGYVNRQWTINNLSGTPNAALTLNWNSPADEMGIFASAVNHISRYNGSNWISLGDGPASCGTQCSRTTAGVTVFNAPFTIGSLYPTIAVSGTVGAGPSTCYNAAQTITVAGNGNNFTVNNGGNVTMIAGINIRYLPGTIVHLNGYMHGYINYQFCGQLPPALPAVSTGGVEQPAMDTDQPTFTIYPNPTSGNFTLEQKSKKTNAHLKVAIYGMHGEMVMTGDLTGGEMKHEYQTSGLPSGFYFVKVTADGFFRTFKLVKTK